MKKYLNFCALLAAFAALSACTGNSLIADTTATQSGDNVGNLASNKALSLKRAQSVANYLIKEHNMPANRFVIVGNGPDKPIADNNTADGKSKNRRTDFELLAN